MLIGLNNDVKHFGLGHIVQEIYIYMYSLFLTFSDFLSGPLNIILRLVQS